MRILMSRPVCVIVGAGEGLGQALAKKFAHQGYNVALISRSLEGSAKALKVVKQVGTDGHHFYADAQSPETIETAIANVISEMGEIEVLIYNARGDFTACKPLEISYEQLLEVYNLEVVGAFAAAKSVLPKMIKQGSGSIFFSSATAAYRGSSTHPLYAIGKFGLRALSQSLTKEYAKNGVHIVHVRLDCDLDVPYMKESYGVNYNSENLANPHDVAESYWLTHLQPKSAWSNEIELRPYSENWTY